MSGAARPDAVGEAVVAYERTVVVPEFDRAAIASRRRPARPARPRVRLRIASLVACCALLALVDRRSAVVAGVEHLFAAFTLVAGRPVPLALRVVELARAHADMPFGVIDPPRIDGERLVRIREVTSPVSRADASVIFEFRGTSPDRDVTIVEGAGGRRGFAPTSLFETDDTDAPPSPSTDRSRAQRVRSGPIRGIVAGRPFVPITWTSRGTRVVIMSPPGVLTTAQANAIRRAMSR